MLLPRPLTRASRVACRVALGGAARAGACAEQHVADLRLRTCRRFAAGAADVLRMRVKAEVTDFGRLAGGVLARARGGLVTELDAVGEDAVSNAVKAVAIANAFAEQEASQGVAFVPEMVSEEGSRKLLRLVVSPRPRGAEKLPGDFSQGGIYVPVDMAAAGARGAQARGGRGGGGEGGDAARRPATPTELARTALGQWLRFAAPELRAAARGAAAGRAAGGAGEAVAKAGDAPGRGRAPFLLTMGAPALSRAAKAMAFVCSDLQSDHLAGAPAAVVVPKLWERCSRDRKTGLEKRSRCVVLCLARAALPPR